MKPIRQQINIPVQEVKLSRIWYDALYDNLSPLVSKIRHRFEYMIQLESLGSSINGTLKDETN